MKNQNYQHLTLDQRIEIQQCLSHSMSFMDIGKRIGKDQTTVSREVKRHIVIRQTTVSRTAKDGTPMNKPCELLLKAPFVCNPCKNCHRICSFDKHVYSAKDAQKAYIEKNHTLFIDIVPQGSSFGKFTQDTVSLIFSLVNSVKRKTLNGRTPYQLLAFEYGDDLPILLGIDIILAEGFVQSHFLLKH